MKNMATLFIHTAITNRELKKQIILASNHYDGLMVYINLDGYSVGELRSLLHGTLQIKSYRNLKMNVYFYTTEALDSSLLEIMQGFSLEYYCAAPLTDPLTWISLDAFKQRLQIKPAVFIKLDSEYWFDEYLLAVENNVRVYFDGRNINPETFDYSLFAAAMWKTLDRASENVNIQAIKHLLKHNTTTSSTIEDIFLYSADGNKSLAKYFKKDLMEECNTCALNKICNNMQVNIIENVILGDCQLVKMLSSIALLAEYIEDEEIENEEH